ncbi:Thaumatin-like protein 1 [Cocos nucifera]|uniref:Thaumatin-like protein 1 n=1 Tax=Cocos nucifera TaxID=13894 RepID=A0A8K0IDV0_COCNU|nr:Thaumatin-like protein 1 [Cocos nucifera]
MAQAAALAAAPLRNSLHPWLTSLLFTQKPYPLSFFSSPASRGPRGPRPLGPLVAGDDDTDSDAPPAAKKSRNELKREARRAVRWGMELSTFSRPQIKRVLRVASLDREVFDALMLVKRLGPDVREGKRRQFNYIGRLLRKAQPDLMDALIQASKDGDNSRLLALSGQETWSIEDDEEEEETTYEEEESENHIEIAARWFDGLVYKDPSITNEVYSVENVEFDRQELRKLVRRVQSIEGLQVDENVAEYDAMLTEAKKPLIRFLRSLAKRSLAEERCLSATFTLTNNCEYTVWPGLLSGAGTAPLETTGFALENGESRSLTVPYKWSGRIWGRTLCSTNSTTGKFTCVTGDCGSSTVECSGSGAAPPATLAEFTLDGSGGMDFYDVSLVDGFNLPMLVMPQGASPGGNCSSTGCLVALNGLCPSDLKVVAESTDGASESVACKSACDAFGSPQYCCSGAYGNPDTCKPSSYSQFFKNACPRAYSYAYDDATSTFTCYNANYLITFCPSTGSVKSAGENPAAAAGLPLINNTMVFLSGDQASSGRARAVRLPTTFAVLAASWLLSRQL